MLTSASIEQIGEEIKKNLPHGTSKEEQRLVELGLQLLINFLAGINMIAFAAEEQLQETAAFKEGTHYAFPPNS